MIQVLRTASIRSTHLSLRIEAIFIELKDSLAEEDKRDRADGGGGGSTDMSDVISESATGIMNSRGDV